MQPCLACCNECEGEGEGVDLHVDVQNLMVCVLDPADPDAHDACDAPVRRSQSSHSSHSSRGSKPTEERRVPGDSSGAFQLKHRSGTANVFNEEVMTHAALKDCYNNYMLLIGNSDHLLPLARARLQQGLRLCVIDVAGAEERVERVQADTFMRAWDPPPSECSHAVCKLWGHLAAHQPRHWLLRGPDLVRLLPGQVLQIVEVEQYGIGVVVRNAAGQLSWALEGYVVNVAGYEPRSMPTLREHLRNEGIEELIDQVGPEFQEAKPYGMFDKPHVFLSSALLIPVLGLNITGWMVFSRASFGGLEFFRGLFLFIVCLPIYRFGSSFWGEAFAGHYTSWRFHAVLTACAATVSMSLPWLFRLLGLGIPSTMMMVSGGAMTLIGCSVFQLYWQRRMGRLLRNFWRHLQWGCAIVVLSFGVWLCLYVSATIYILLISIQSPLSVVFLPVATWLLECGTVLSTTLAARHIVFWPRHESEADAIDGDQRLHVIPCAIACAHGFSEATRLTATLAGAVRSGNTGGIGALVLSFFLNLWARSGWGRFFTIWSVSKLTKFLPCCTMKPLAWLAPTILSKLHDEVKVTLGYPRFSVIVTLIISWLLADVLSGPMGTARMQLPENWDSALIICAVALSLEVAEDIVVLGMDKCVQAPVTGKAMDHFQNFANEDPYQSLAVVMRSDLEFSSKTLPLPTSPVSRLSIYSSDHRISPNSVAITHMGPQDTTRSGILRCTFGQNAVVHHAKGLHGLRKCKFVVVFGMTMTAASFTLILLELLLGPAYVYGHCVQPLPLAETLLKTLFWSLPLADCHSS